MHKNQFSIHDRKAPLKLSVMISMILIFIMLFTFVFAKLRDAGRGLYLSDVFTVRSVITFLINTLLLYILFRFQFWAIKRKRNSHRKNILLPLLGSILLIFILSPIFAYVQWRIFKEPVSINMYLTVHLFKDLIVLLITLLFTSLTHLWEHTQKALIENQKLLTENLQNRYDVLKNQVDPHFLFNSLNTLNGLIGYDDDKAHEYVDQLSSVFRYTMQNKQIITLEEELNFAESYMYLMKIRYDESLQIKFHPDKKYFEYYILPFGLQLLIENAIKHNVISMKYPLKITIETTERDTIKVINNVHLKPNNAHGGIGLANLNERYQLLFNKEIEIIQDENFFSVEIPLIKEIEKYDHKFRCEL